MAKGHAYGQDLMNFMLRPYAEAFVRIFYPAACALCAKRLELEERSLCFECAQKLNRLAWSPDQTWMSEHFEFLDDAWAVYAYRPPLKQLLHAVKYARRGHLLEQCREPALSLAHAVSGDRSYDAVLPVPIHRLKRLKRHFNQSEILAELLRPAWSVPVIRSLLVKRHPIPSQTSLDHEERAINIYGAFRVRSPRKARGRSFLLVDDVVTTGATANEAARVLKSCGARRVDLLALARASGPDNDLPEKQIEIHPARR
ncbi:MAG: ComF family protein [Candidatus Omnitrophica bacterium]|nr:ComF family protein [Candidatus Omnitrophota bacterium]